MKFSITGRANHGGYQEPNRTKELLDILKESKEEKESEEKKQQYTSIIIKLQQKIIELQSKVIELESKLK